MTAVANPPTFPQISRPAWGSVDGNSMNPDEARGMFVPRRTLSRTNSSSSTSSNSSNASGSTILSNGAQSTGTPASTASDLSQWSASAASRKRPRNQNWPGAKGEVQPDFSRAPAPGRPNGMVAQHGPMQPGPNQAQMSQQGMMARPMSGEQMPSAQPVLYLLSLNGTFERKTIAVPYAPDTLRIGRQTNQKTIPTAANGFFDSKVLSRQHAEVYAERNGKIFIRDVKSSNGTFVNGSRLSQENRESEPHELSTGDHLELGIDIVSEDQKTVVHHKVAAKVEHAGFMSSSNNVLDMNFGDLDPANSSAMMAAGPMQARGRTGSNTSMASNGRMIPAVNGQGMMQGQQRPFFLSPVATDQILKKLTNEMRSARLQAQDLGRASQFVDTLLSKNDVKDLDKPENPEIPRPPHLVNGGPPSFRADPKARFSEPPAPPPQQPLPEKPSVPPLKRGAGDRPKSGPPESLSPVRQENMSQIVQLTEALNNAKRDIDTQTARMRELETMLQKEREARELAENLAKRLGETTSTHVNGSAAFPAKPQGEEESSLESTTSAHDGVESHAPTEGHAANETAVSLQARIDTMEDQMKDLRQQVEEWRHRSKVAESERDADRKTLAEMVIQLREEQAQNSTKQKGSRSRSRRRASEAKGDTKMDDSPRALGAQKRPEVAQAGSADSTDDASDEPTLSRANTITPLNPGRGVLPGQQQLHAGMPYVSALGVVLIGMGLMAYINGWQSPPPRIER